MRGTKRPGQALGALTALMLLGACVGAEPETQRYPGTVQAALAGVSSADPSACRPSPDGLTSPGRPRRTVDGVPAVGVPRTLPGGEQLIRLTSGDTDGFGAWFPEYSKASAWNSDGSRLLLTSPDARYRLFDAGSLKPQGLLPLPVGAPTPRWSKLHPWFLYYVDGLSFCQIDVRTGTTRVVRSFGKPIWIDAMSEEDLVVVGGRLTTVLATVPSMLSDGSPARINAFVVDWSEAADGTVSGFTIHQRATVWDASDPKYHARLDYAEITPDGNVFINWGVKVPSGRLRTLEDITTLGHENYFGYSLYDTEMAFQRKIARTAHHADVCTDSNGNEVVVFIGSDDDDPRDTIDGAYLTMVRLNDGQRTPLVQLDWAAGGHVSCRSYLNPGWAFISTQYEGSSAPQIPALSQSIFAVKLDPAANANSRVGANYSSTAVNSPAETVDLFDHPCAVGDYFDEPHATSDPWGRQVVFGCNWGKRVRGIYDDAYLIRGITLPA